MDQPPQRSWWSRNWLWVVPVGCLTPILLCCGGFTLFSAIFMGAIKSSDVYVDSLAKAKANTEVIALLGEPIEAGFWTNGQIEVSGASGKANLAIPISGPKGSATIYAVATKVAGNWEYSTMEVAGQNTDARIDLRTQPDK